MGVEIARIDIVLFGEAGHERTAIGIETTDGIRGENVTDGVGFLAAVRCAPSLIGRDPLARERHWSECKRALRKFDATGLGIIDTALWDLAGKYHETPVHRLLGTYRTRLPAYLSVGAKDRHRTDGLPARFADIAAEARDAGYRGFKIRFTRDSIRDVDEGTDEGGVSLVTSTVRAVGERVGDDVAVMLDTTTELETYAQALEVGRACDEQGAFWFEDPFKDGGQSQHAYRKLGAAIETPLLLTELVQGLEVRTDFAINDATDFLRADPYWHGGITGAMKMAHVAEGLGLDIEYHAMGPASRHCMAATRNSNFYEINTTIDRYDEYLDAIDDDGAVVVSDEPGLGVNHDWDEIERRAIISRRFE